MVGNQTDNNLLFFHKFDTGSYRVVLKLGH